MMYILALLMWNDLNDVLVEMQWYTTLSDAVAAGDEYVGERKPGDHYQIWKPVPCSTDMNLIKVGPDK